VRKPTGDKDYVLWVGGVPVYDVPGSDKKILVFPDLYVLQSVSGLSVITPDTKLKICCDGVECARFILNSIEEVEKGLDKLL